MSTIQVYVPGSASYATKNTDDYVFLDIPQGAGWLSFNNMVHTVIKIFDARGYHKYWFNDGQLQDFTYGGAVLTPKDYLYVWKEKPITSLLINKTNTASVNHLNNDSFSELWESSRYKINGENMKVFSFTEKGKAQEEGNFIGDGPTADSTKKWLYFNSFPVERQVICLYTNMNVLSNTSNDVKKTLKIVVGDYVEMAGRKLPILKGKTKVIVIQKKAPTTTFVSCGQSLKKEAWHETPSWSWAEYNYFRTYLNTGCSVHSLDYSAALTGGAVSLTSSKDYDFNPSSGATSAISLSSITESSNISGVPVSALMTFNSKDIELPKLTSTDHTNYDYEYWSGAQVNNVQGWIYAGAYTKLTCSKFPWPVGVDMPTTWATIDYDRAYNLSRGSHPILGVTLYHSSSATARFKEIIKGLFQGDIDMLGTNSDSTYGSNDWIENFYYTNKEENRTNATYPNNYPVFFSGDHIWRVKYYHLKASDYISKMNPPSYRNETTGTASKADSLYSYAVFVVYEP